MRSVEVNNISKSYLKGKVQAVRDVSFSVDKGEVFGVIGPDGAGKTTLIRVLNTLLLADAGVAAVEGYDVVKGYKAIRGLIGYMPGRFSLYQDLTVEENLRVFAAIFKVSIEENYYLIQDIYQQLEPFRKRRAGKLSGGMKQKLALCCALIHKPEVLFLDEPTTGVDPVSRREFWEMLKRLKEQGITIIVSTPYMDEATLCDRIALMMDGSFLKIAPPARIVGEYDRILWAVRSDRMSPLLTDLRDNPNVDSCYAFGEDHHVTIGNPDFTQGQLQEYLMSKGHTGVAIRTIAPDIEDCFMELASK